jgi:hypothetical protein
MSKAKEKNLKTSYYYIWDVLDLDNLLDWKYVLSIPSSYSDSVNITEFYTQPSILLQHRRPTVEGCCYLNGVNYVYIKLHLWHNLVVANLACSSSSHFPSSLYLYDITYNYV